ncbi:hypothetical protein LFYK43_09170 [Ligilactobacillus salitolerans]|uniref:Uncharacterized protein n=1 Tax=Ligilactobacillus salitolerans TaxID=1808352 RepID=A0A401ISF5_9LACO|nr:hypothetical protein [Ligilactobacillus salitolerans]GBG94458.1 hypothetical protein LFYK43_09170 [Ligilactobacillus salitolerans]
MSQREEMRVRTHQIISYLDQTYGDNWAQNPQVADDPKLKAHLQWIKACK